MPADKSEVLQGTLDLMILKTLHALGPLHGFGIARRIEQLSEDVLALNEGTVYTSLLRLQQKSWITSEWGISENNRRARFSWTLRKTFHSLADSFSARSFIAYCKEVREHAFARLPRWEIRAIERRRRWHGCVRTTKNPCAWSNWQRLPA